MSVTDFHDLNWFDSLNLDVAMIYDEGDSSLVVEKGYDVFARPLYFPSVNYDNQFHSLEPTPDPIAARLTAWHKFQELTETVQFTDAPPIDDIYVRTSSDGFVDELEQLP